jgi:hypothetical protein
MSAVHGDIRIEANLDRIDALADEREAEWRRIGAAGFLSDDEKREALGYGPLQSEGQHESSKDCDCRKDYYGEEYDGHEYGLAFDSSLGSDCEEEWEDARERCRTLLAMRSPPRGLTGGYHDVESCARGFVSQRCGGNPVG